MSLSLGDLLAFVPSILTGRLQALGIVSGSGAYVASGTQGVVAVTNGVGSESQLTTTQAGSLVTNTGTTVKASCKLPASPSVGMFYDFLCDDADGLRIVANTGQTITVGALGASASAGYVETVRQDSAMRLTYTASNVWRASQIGGTWRLDSTTSAGFAFTPHIFTATMAHSWDADVDVSESALYCTQVGVELNCRGQISFAGAPPNTALSVTLPNSWVTAVSAGEPSTGNASAPCGQGLVYDQGVGVLAPCPARVDEPASTAIYFTTSAATSAYFSATAPITWASGDHFIFNFTVPVT